MSSCLFRHSRQFLSVRISFKSKETERHRDDSESQRNKSVSYGKATRTHIKGIVRVLERKSVKKFIRGKSTSYYSNLHYCHLFLICCCFFFLQQYLDRGAQFSEAGLNGALFNINLHTNNILQNTKISDYKSINIVTLNYCKRLG